MDTGKHLRGSYRVGRLLRLLGGGDSELVSSNLKQLDQRFIESRNKNGDGFQHRKLCMLNRLANWRCLNSDAGR